MVAAEADADGGLQVGSNKRKVSVIAIDRTPEKLANVIVFALSNASSFVNGAVLVADNAQDKS